MPTKPRSVAPLFFSMISCTSRTKVRSISDADINCAFSRRFAWRFDVRGDMNAASYACRAGRSKVSVCVKIAVHIQGCQGTSTSDRAPAPFKGVEVAAQAFAGDSSASRGRETHRRLGKIASMRDFCRAEECAAELTNVLSGTRGMLPAHLLRRR